MVKNILIIIFLFFTIQILNAKVLAEFSLKTAEKEYHKVHPTELEKKVVFDIPGKGYIRYCYTDSAYNSEAESGGLSWRNVPGATNYAKAPGGEIKLIKKPKYPKTGQSYKIIAIRDVKGPIKKIGIVLTPLYRRTWNAGGIQYLTDLHVKLEWSPNPFTEQDQDPEKSLAEEKTKQNESKAQAPESVYTGIWKRFEHGKLVESIHIKRSGSGYVAIFNVPGNPDYSRAVGNLKQNLLELKAQKGIVCKIEVKGDMLFYRSYNSDGTFRWKGKYSRDK